MARILVVDDEPNILSVLKSVLMREGHDLVCVPTGEEAMEQLAGTEFDLMISDLRLGRGMDGLELLHRAHLADKRLTVIMITAYGTVDVAVEAMKEGAFDFITKPFKLETLLETVKNAIHHREVSETPVAETVGADEEPPRFGRLVGRSAEMQAVYQLIERVGKTDATVLIQGESGTGKELVAEAIHQQGNRAAGPLVPLNCAALSPTLLESEMFGHTAGAFTGATKARDGLFMAANKGTLFLDEIGSMDLSIQGKLLRALQEKKIRRVGDNRDVEVDVRVIAATNEPLERMRDNGQFREDLYYRISVIPVHLPPLRHRTEDIPLLAKHFCRLQSEALGHEIRLGPEVMSALVEYAWPGNVRELQNAMACAAALCSRGLVTVNDLPPHVRGNLEDSIRTPSGTLEPGCSRTLRDFLRIKEQEYLEQILDSTGGNRVKAAEMLGISRATLYRKLPEA